MAKKLCILVIVLLGNIPAFGHSVDIPALSKVFLDTLLYQGWESGVGNWWVDNGVWEVGVPTFGPDSGHAGHNCAGTILGGNYPSDANTRLISPQISLPNLPSGERLQLKFWNWFRLYESAHGPDEGHIQIKVSGDTIWQTIAGPFSGTSPVWTQVCVDLSAYVGLTVRVAFYFTSDWVYEDNGWYVDDVAIIKGPVTFNNPEGFEQEVGDWSVDNGLWEVGTPGIGPDSARFGQNCAGTILGGNYPNDANTRLISPLITLPPLLPGERLRLKFWHWFRLYESAHGPDEGHIQISVNGGNWQTIAGPFSGTSPVWTQVCVDLSAYADSTVRIAFYFTSDWVYEDNGWYVDDVEIIKGQPVFNIPEDFEQGVGDWSADNGLWEVGVPTVGPDSAHSVQNCAGTILRGNYPSDANTRLISPEITLTPDAGANPELFFWHWFRLYESAHGPDEGRIQISVNGGNWQTIAGPFSGASPVWTQVYIDLLTYADSTVRIAFYFTSDWVYEDNGWYIDDVRIEGITTDICEPPTETSVPKSFALYQNHPNPFNQSTQIEFTLAKPGFVSLNIYDILGRKVRTLILEHVSSGYKSVLWNGKNDSGNDVASGIYFYQLRVGDFSETKKLVLLK